MRHFLLLAIFGFAAPAQAEPEFQFNGDSCFYAQGTYLVVDGNGQNMLLELKGEDCQNLKVAYGPRGNDKFTANLQTGGWRPLPKIESPLPMDPKGEYELLWENRKLTVNTRGKLEDGTLCTVSFSFGYDTYVPETSSFQLKTVTECAGEEKREKEATLYAF